MFVRQCYRTLRNVSCDKLKNVLTQHLHRTAGPCVFYQHQVLHRDNFSVLVYVMSPWQHFTTLGGYLERDVAVRPNRVEAPFSSHSFLVFFTTVSLLIFAWSTSPICFTPDNMSWQSSLSLQLYTKHRNSE